MSVPILPAPGKKRRDRFIRFQEIEAFTPEDVMERVKSRARIFAAYSSVQPVSISTIFWEPMRQGTHFPHDSLR